MKNKKNKKCENANREAQNGGARLVVGAPNKNGGANAVVGESEVVESVIPAKPAADGRPTETAPLVEATTLASETPAPATVNPKGKKAATKTVKASAQSKPKKNKPDVKADDTTKGAARKGSAQVKKDDGEGKSAKPLTDDEKERFANCEEEVQSGQRGYFAMGRALSIINHERLYREEFKTFDEYCKSKWGFTAKHAYEFINAYVVVCEMEENADEKIDKPDPGNAEEQKSTAATRPDNLSQALSLKGVSKNQRKAVMENAATLANAAGRRMTAADLEAAKKELVGSDDDSNEEEVEKSVVVLPIVGIEDVLLWVKEAQAQLEAEKINDLGESLERIRGALVSYLKSNEVKKAA